jgi:zinc protease
MQLPPLSEHRLGNGLRVVLVPHGFTPLVAIAVLYQVGSQEESPECAGVAHLVEHLAFGSSAYLEAEEFDRYCSDAGGTNNAYTTYSYTLYHMVLPAHQLELGLWLEASRMRALPIPEEEFRLQQRVIIEEIKETVLNQPYGRWRELQAQQAFRPECPYHWEVYGSVETVAALSVEQAREFVRSYYRPDNACVVLCGNFASEQALELVEATLGQIPAPATPIPRRSFSPECRLGNRSVSFPMRSISQRCFSPSTAADTLPRSFPLWSCWRRCSAKGAAAGSTVRSSWRATAPPRSVPSWIAASGARC